MVRTLNDFIREYGEEYNMTPKVETKPTSMAGAMKQFVSKDRIQQNATEGNFPLSSQEIRIEQACTELAQTLIMKTRDYGRGSIDEFGQLGVLVQIGNKYNRLKNLINSGEEAQFEPIEDSWKDLAGYAVIGWLNSQGRW